MKLAEMNQAEGMEAVTGPGASSRDRPFRVIVAGAGVAGLTISHALQRAGIDHVILEKGVIAPQWGASISLWGHGSRIMNQIGCLDALEAEALPLQVLHTRDQNGTAFSQEAFFTMMKERNGFEAITMERRNFLRIVHEQLPDKTKIKCGKRVIDVIDHEDGVTVKLQDGTTEEGDILIGCDGVHSTVRELMWRNANLSEPGLITAKEKRSLVVTYKSLVGVAKTPPGLGIRDMHWVSHRGLSFLILTQPDQTYFFVNWKMPQKMRWPSKAKWSDEEAERAAASVADLPISDTVVFGELWKNKVRGHLIGLEEGIFDHWHHGRLVLVGDSVHKVTPNFALGAQIGLESAVVLLNEIHSLLNPISQSAPNSSKETPSPTSTTTLSQPRPSKQAIKALFTRYQTQRLPRTQAAYDASHFITRMQAYDGNIKHFIMRYIFPLQGQASYADKLADLCAGAPKFDFLDVKYKFPASVTWKDEVGGSGSVEEEGDGDALKVLAEKWNYALSVVEKKFEKDKGVVMEFAALVVLVLFVYVVFGAGGDGQMGNCGCASGERMVLDQGVKVQRVGNWTC